MPDNSLTLRIADLTIRFYCRERKDATFLRKKYADYLIDEEGNLRIAARIYLSSGKPRVREISKDSFEIILPTLKRRLLSFNDHFRNIFVYYLLRNNGLLLHASALAKNRQGYVFAGPQGAGKSTVRKISRKFTCLGDDSAIIRKKNKQYFLFGSPFYQKTRTFYPNRKVILRAVMILRQSYHDRLMRLAKDIAAKKILENAFLSGLGPKREEMEILFNYSWLLVKKVPVFDLYFRKSDLFWNLVEKGIEKRAILSPIEPIIEAINPRVRQRLPQKIGWEQALTFAPFLKDCLVIRERSWNFEFDGQREVEKLAKLPLSLGGSHTLIIKRMEQASRRQDKQLFWFPLIEKNGRFTLIDGNHRAIAMVRKREVSRRQIIGLLVGQLLPKETCSWI